MDEGLVKPKLFIPDRFQLQKVHRAPISFPILQVWTESKGTTAFNHAEEVAFCQHIKPYILVLIIIKKKTKRVEWLWSLTDWKHRHKQWMERIKIYQTAALATWQHHWIWSKQWVVKHHQKQKIRDSCAAGANRPAMNN
jgi:hypothetical protein